MNKFKEWFYGRVDIPSRVWYLLMCIGATIYIVGIMLSIRY